ncbi:nuclease-related domain-containing protein [Pseudalkalibacillus sp. A8]|uniref:nuclease-related domain-containing protein n=1 Tax=Pseudalkalibacillus sp. A8 TaxID=3382641 RepID=UPI0038B5B5E2
MSTAGERGERSLDYYLSFINEKEYTFFNGIRLSSGKFYFQIDTLLINPNFILILEVKNLSGTLIFDTDHTQLIQQFESKEVMHKDPIQQLDNQLFQFQEWLDRHEFPSNIPIYSYVVITNDKCKIVPTNNNSLLTKKLIRKDVLRNTIRNLKELHKKEFLSIINLTKLRNLLIKQHIPLNPDLLKHLQISRDELITGVQCPRCYIIPMERVYGKWICLECKTNSKNAHIDTLRDYCLLIQPTITNQQLRKYLHIKSV